MTAQVSEPEQPELQNLRETIKAKSRRDGHHPIAVLALAADLLERHMRSDSEDTHLVYQYAELRRWIDGEIHACLAHERYTEFD